MEIRAPVGPDRPGLGPLSAAIGLGLGTGLLLAASAVGSPAPASPEPLASADVEGSPVLPPGESIVETTSADGTGADHAAGAEAELPAEPPALVEPPEARVVEDVAARTPLGETPPGSPRGWTRLAHGRIAYLRCEGAPAAEGTPASDAASGCPRDRELEAHVWGVVDGLVDCPSAPAAPGEMDLVIDLAAGASAEVRTRDRFAPDVVRLDAPAVLSCLTEPLSSAASSLGASRLVVSFRFRAEP